MAEVSTEQRNQPAVISLPIGEHGSCAWFVRVFQEIVTLEGWSLPPFLKKRQTPNNKTKPKPPKQQRNKTATKTTQSFFLLRV